MASIKEKTNKDGSLSFLIEVYCGRDPEGKKLIERTTYRPKAAAPTKARKEAEKFAAQYEEQILSGDVVSGDNITFAQFTKIWEENWLPAKTPAVRENYSTVLRVRVIPKIGNLKMTKIRATHIDKIVKDETAEGKAPSTVHMTYTVINSVFKYAVRKQYIRENPCTRCDELPAIQSKTGNDIQFFTRDQARRFLKDALTREYDIKIKAHKRKLKKTGEVYTVPGYTTKHTVHFQWRVYFELAIKATFRREEECALTWRDIDFSKHTVSVNKAMSCTKKEGQFVKDTKTPAGVRDMVIPADCIALLRVWKKEQRALCLKLGTAWKGHRDRIEDGRQVDSFEDNTIFIQLDNGLPLHLSTPGHKFAEIIKLYNAAIEEEAAQLESKAEKRQKLAEKLPKIRLHDLKHTGATLLIGENVDIETVSRRCGHSKASVTLNIYGHALPENDKKASDALAAVFG